MAVPHQPSVSHQPPMGGAKPHSSAEQAGERIKDSAESAVKDIKQSGKQIQATAASAFQDVKHSGEDFVTEQKAKAADELSTWGTAIRSAADRLRDADDPHAARYAEMAAERLDGFASFISEHDVRTIIGSVERAARKRPALFLGGMFLVGLGVSRFLKASRSDDPSSSA